LSKLNTNILDTEIKYKLVYSFSNTEIYYIPSTKYKTNTITFFFIDNLRKETVSKNALIPAMLRRGCNKYPNMNEISLQMEKLYGASLDCGVIKKGEFHIVFFYAECISDDYIPVKIKYNNNQNIFRNCVDMLINIITDPIVKEGGFRPDILNQEREILKRLIEGRINDKLSYSIIRCIEEMCKDEPYGIYQYGDVHGLYEVNEERLYDHYKQLIYAHPLKVFISGNVSEENIEYLIKVLAEKRTKDANDNSQSYIDINYNHINNNQNLVININNQSSMCNKIKEVNEVFEVTQAKLSVGFRTNVYPKDKDYYALFVCTGILDGDMNSKLYKNIREKAGLAYYIFSSFEKLKGLFIISCGIDARNKKKTVELILEQIEAIKSGDISEVEYNSAIKSIETVINSIKDDQLQVVDFYFGQLLSGMDDDFDTLMRKVKNVSINDIVEVSRKIEPELIYLLSSGSEAYEN
jgi:predicted Zn-dependent peptidase